MLHWRSCQSCRERSAASASSIKRDIIKSSAMAEHKPCLLRLVKATLEVIFDGYSAVQNSYRYSCGRAMHESLSNLDRQSTANFTIDASIFGSIRLSFREMDFLDLTAVELS